jgi:hypothetical protein
MTVPATPKNEHKTAAETAARQLAATCAIDSWTRSGASCSDTLIPHVVGRNDGRPPQQLAAGQVAATHPSTVNNAILNVFSG